MIIKKVTVNKEFSKIDAQLLVQRMMRYDSDVSFEKDTMKINGKSLMGVIGMGLKKGDSFIVIVKGDDQDSAVAEIERLIKSNFSAN